MVPRRNARGGRSAAENLIAALRCLYRHAEDDGLIDERDNPARKVDKPRRLPSTRRAVNDTRLAEINQIAATTGDDPELDTLILRLHTETACRRGGALALRPADLDREQCLILLREKGETVRWQPVSPTLMAALVRHAEERHAPPDGRLLRYRDGRPVTYRRYDGLWVRIGRHLPWVRTQQISTHWLRHTTLTWVERNFGFAIAHAYAGHTDGAGDTGSATSTYVRATLAEVATALAALTGEPHPLAEPEGRRSMTALADLPVPQTDPRAYRGPGSPRSRTGSGPRCGPGRGPLRGGPGPCEDHAVLAAAGPRRPRRGRSMVRLGRHRAEDRLRHGPPAAGHLVLASPGHSRHPPGRGRVLRGLRAARLARHRPRDQRPDPAVRQAVSDLLVRARHGRAGRVPPDGPGPGHHGRPGPSPPSCPASRSWSWAWGPPWPTCCARTPQQPTAHRPTLPDQPLACRPAWRPAEQSGDQPDQNPAGPDRHRAPPAGPDRTLPRHDGHGVAESRHPPLTLQSRASTTPAVSPASLPEQGSTSPGGLCAAEGSKARTRRLTPWRSGSAPS